jgi:hypothetical protein
MKLEEQDLVRFWAKIQVLEENECWLWTGAKSSKGYGRFKVKGKLLAPHRIIYTLFNKNELMDLFVCHSCDNPPCCNPSHLFAGTNSENMKDCFQKGRITMPIYRGGRKKGMRGRQGERSHFSKLKNEDVLQIRALSDQGIKPIILSELFNVTSTCIRLIIKRKTWKHI